MTTLRTLALPDHTVTYVDRPASDGPGATPLVLLHGGASDHRTWTHQLEAFSERRTIAPDARGHGGSSDATESYRLADDVAALLDALDVDRAVLAGVSMGGGTAVDVALEHPDRVAGLVVTGTGTSEPVFEDAWALGLFAQWQRAEAAGDAVAWVDTFMEFTYGPCRTADDLDPDVVRLVRDMAEQVLAHVHLDEDGRPVPPVRPTPVTGTWERVPDLAPPVLVLNGLEDGDDHLANGRRLARLAPRAQVVELEGAAHYPMLERPAEYTRAVRDFLAAHDL